MASGSERTSRGPRWHHLCWSDVASTGLSGLLFPRPFPPLPPPHLFSLPILVNNHVCDWNVGTAAWSLPSSARPCCLRSPGLCPPPTTSSCSLPGDPALAQSKPWPLDSPCPNGGPLTLWDLLVSCPAVGLTCFWNYSFELSRPLFATTTLWDMEIGLCGGPGRAGWAQRDGLQQDRTQCHHGRQGQVATVSPVRPFFLPRCLGFPLCELEQNSEHRLGS